MKRNIIALVAPIITGIICAGVSIRLLSTGIYLYRLEFILNAIITCAVTFSGFILTSVSILIGLSSSPLMRHIRNTGGLSELRSRYTESLVLGLVLIVICTLIGADVDETNYVRGQLTAIGIGALGAYALSMITTGYYLLGVIGLLPSESPIDIKHIPSKPNGNFRI